MTIGLNFLASVIDTEAGAALLRISEELMIGEPEVEAYRFTKRYYRQYRAVPSPRDVQEQTGVRLPQSRGTLQFHTDQLYDRQQFECIRETYAEFREAIGTHTPGPAVAVLEQGLRRIRRNSRGGNLIDIAQGMDQVTERLERVRGLGGMSGIPTPWPTMNRATAGYQPADLITYVGRMGIGKTMNLLYQAERAFLEGHSALFVTTEMGSEQITRRWMAMRYGLNSDMLKSGMVSNNLMRLMRGFKADLLGRERFRILSLGTNAKVSAVEAAVEEISPDVIYVDGVYLLKPSAARSMNRTETVSYVFDELKQLTIDTSRPFVVNTQFNRQAGAKGKEGTLETIGMSDVIAQHSSIVVAVKPGPTANPMDSRELDLLKGREGEQAGFPIHFTFRPTNLDEMTHEEIEAIGGADHEAGETTADYTWS